MQQQSTYDMTCWAEALAQAANENLHKNWCLKATILTFHFVEGNWMSSDDVTRHSHAAVLMLQCVNGGQMFRRCCWNIKITLFERWKKRNLWVFLGFVVRFCWSCQSVMWNFLNRKKGDVEAVPALAFHLCITVKCLATYNLSDFQSTSASVDPSVDEMSWRCLEVVRK